jgi:hypothetical protein
MLKKLRRSSSRVTLVLIGVAALSGCGKEEQRRDVYASKADCLADWGNKPEDCTPASDKRYQGSGFFWGPLYAMGAMNALRGGGSSWTGDQRPGSRAIGSAVSGGSPTRGGFGSSGRSSVS